MREQIEIAGVAVRSVSVLPLRIRHFAVNTSTIVHMYRRLSVWVNGSHAESADIKSAEVCTGLGGSCKSHRCIPFGSALPCNAMEKIDSKANRHQTLELLASLERQMAALVKLTGHQSEIAACQKAIERLKERLADPSNI
jgi:hypothetical protein